MECDTPQNQDQPLCSFECPTESPCAEAGTFSLTEALSRFEREAVHGVCDNGRYRCPYYTWGSGPPLLFIHGLGDVARAYVPVISLLASDFRCIAYDLPVGRNDGAYLRRYTHAQLVADVFALLDHLGLRQSYVFGSSMGATVALAALHASHDRLPRAVLAGGFARRPLAKPEALLAHLAVFWPGTMRRLPLRRWAGYRALGPTADRRPEMRDLFLRLSGTPPIKAVAWRALIVKRVDLCSLLPEIRQPVLLICGDGDALVDRSCEEVLQRGLPHVSRVELADCGHLQHYTHPEVVAALVRQFLTPPDRSDRDGKVPLRQVT
jgi:aminoacrylate hydrolase